MPLLHPPPLLPPPLHIPAEMRKLRILQGWTYWKILWYLDFLSPFIHLDCFMTFNSLINMPLINVFSMKQIECASSVVWWKQYFLLTKSKATFFHRMELGIVFNLWVFSLKYSRLLMHRKLRKGRTRTYSWWNSNSNVCFAVEYGNTGCGVFKGGIKNYWILRIGVVASCQKLGIILELKWFKNWCYQ